MSRSRLAVATTLVAQLVMLGCATSTLSERASGPSGPIRIADAPALSALPASAWFVLASAPAAVDPRLGLGAPLSGLVASLAPGLADAVGVDLVDLAAWPGLGLDPRGVAGFALVDHPSDYALVVAFAPVADPIRVRATLAAVARRLELPLTERLRRDASILSVGSMSFVLRPGLLLFPLSEVASVADDVVDVAPDRALARVPAFRAAVSPVDAGDPVVAWYDHHAYGRLEAAHGSLLGGEDEVAPSGEVADPFGAVAADLGPLALGLGSADGAPRVDAFVPIPEDAPLSGLLGRALGAPVILDAVPDAALVLRVAADPTRARALAEGLGLDARALAEGLEGEAPDELFTCLDGRAEVALDADLAVVAVALGMQGADAARFASRLAPRLGAVEPRVAATPDALVFGLGPEAMDRLRAPRVTSAGSAFEPLRAVSASVALGLRVAAIVEHHLAARTAPPPEEETAEGPTAEPEAAAGASDDRALAIAREAGLVVVTARSAVGGILATLSATGSAGTLAAFLRWVQGVASDARASAP